MKLSFYAVTNHGKTYLRATTPHSFRVVKHPLDADIFPGMEELNYYLGLMSNSGWKRALTNGAYSVALVIEEF